MSGLHNPSDFAFMHLVLSMHFTILIKVICGMRAQRMGIAIFIKVALKAGYDWSCSSVKKKTVWSVQCVLIKQLHKGKNQTLPIPIDPLL